MSIIARRAGVRQPLILPPPHSLSKTSSTSAQIVISWTNGAGSGGNTQVYANDVLLATQSRATTSYTHTGLSANTQVTYRVRHINGAAYSPRTAPRTFSTSLGTPISFSVAAVPDTRTIRLDWEASGARTEIYRSDSISGGSSTYYTEVGPYEGRFDDENLPDGTYKYKIRFVTDDATSAFTAEDEAVVDQTVNPPTGLSLSVVDRNTLRVTWSLGESGVDTEVYISDDDTAYTQDGVTSTNATTYDVEGLEYSTLYYVKIRHVRSGTSLTSAYAGPSSETTEAYVSPPAKPTGLTLSTPYTDRAKLDWTPGDVTAKTRIYKGTSEGSLTLLDTVAAAVVTYNDDAVTPTVRYYYAVEHYDDENDLASGQGTTKNVLMPSPQLKNQQAAADIDDTDAVLSWEVDVGPREGLVFWLGPWTDGDGASGGDTYPGGVDQWITSPHEEALSFTVRGKNPGTTHQVFINYTVYLIGNTSGDKLAEDATFWVEPYKDNA